MGMPVTTAGTAAAIARQGMAGALGIKEREAKNFFMLG
jgi:hypothetical protein